MRVHYRIVEPCTLFQRERGTNCRLHKPSYMLEPIALNVLGLVPARVVVTGVCIAIGRVNVMRVPCPRVLSAQILPPWAMMIALTMESPKPLPPVEVVR